MHVNCLSWAPDYKTLSAREPFLHRTFGTNPAESLTKEALFQGKNKSEELLSAFMRTGAPAKNYTTVPTLFQADRVFSPPSNRSRMEPSNALFSRVHQFECNILKGTNPLKRSIRDEWPTFRDLWAKGKQSRLEDKDWEPFRKQSVRLAGEVPQRAEIIAATPAVVASETLKSKKSDGVISDDGPLLRP